MGNFCRGKQVQASTVASSITAVGKTVILDHQINPTKMPNYDNFLPRLHDILAGFSKEYPETNKKYPVEVDVP